MTLYLYSVFGALTMAGEEPSALAALVGEFQGLLGRETALLFSIHHIDEGVAVYVAEAMLREDEMVTAVDIAVGFYDTGVAALGGEGTQAGGDAQPVGECGVENLHEGLAHIVAHPLIEDGAKKVAPFIWLYSHGQYMLAIALYNGGKLEIVAAYVFKKMVEVERAHDIGSMNGGHGVPLHAVAVEHVDALHDFVPRTCITRPL